MIRGWYPFILASIGFILIDLATSMPLFEWKINDASSEFPSTHKVVVLPSPWIAHLGDSLNDGSYVFDNISVSKENKECAKDDFGFFVNRSSRDEKLDQVWLNIYKNISWLSGWSWIEVAFSCVYLLLYVFWFQPGKTFHALILTGIAVLLFLNLTEILRSVALFPLSSPYRFGLVDCQPGSITINVSLIRFHYETLILLLIGILLEFGVLVTVFYQIGQVIKNKEVS